MNNLATIQRIKEVKQHINADALDIVKVLGWEVVTKRNEFKPGDLCIYICIDTIVPNTPTFEFLKNKSFRIKPIRLRGQYSNGICFPLSILPNDINSLSEGDDVTQILNIKKYEKPIPAELSGVMEGHIPSFLIITDEDNLRSIPDAIPEMYGRPYYITKKLDGSSGTYFVHNNTFGVCSRRINLKESETNGFWKIAKKYDIENILKLEFPDKNIAIQGEVYGEGIQKNPLKIKGIDFSIFNLFDIDGRSYLDYTALVNFTNKYNIPMVPIIDEGITFGYNLEDLIELSKKQTYLDNDPAEGIVIRPKESFYSNSLKKSWSGKVINELYIDPT